jgi:hypothetical protein
MRRADPSSRGVLPIVMRRCVRSSNLVNEEVMTHWGVLRKKKCFHMYDWHEFPYNWSKHVATLYDIIH